MILTGSRYSSVFSFKTFWCFLNEIVILVSDSFFPITEYRHMLECFYFSFVLLCSCFTSLWSLYPLSISLFSFNEIYKSLMEITKVLPIAMNFQVLISISSLC